MSREILPAPVDWPGGRRRKPKRRRRHRSEGNHRSHRGHRRSSDDAVSEGVGVAGAVTDQRTTAPPSGERDLRRGHTRRRRKRGVKHRIKRLRHSGKAKQYSSFMMRGSSPREIAKRYERGNRRRRRLVLAGVIIAVGAALSAGAADAYVRAQHVLDEVRDSGESLKQVRANLIQGKLPPAEAFTNAAKAISQAQALVDNARPTWGAVRGIPLLGLPISATEHLLDASRHELNAAVDAKELLEAVLGQTLEEAKAEQDAAAAAKAEAESQPPPPKGQHHKPEENPAPVDNPNSLLNNGTVNLPRLRELMPKMQDLSAQLTAAAAEVGAIGSVPFVTKVQELKADLIGELQQSNRLAERSIAGLNFIPAFLGSQQQKNYLLLFSDSGYLRGTGGAYFAYAEIQVKGGNLSLVKQGPIIDLDRYRNEAVDVPKGNWYLKTFPLSKRMNNLNWDPDFTHTAPVAAQIYKIRTGRDVDGVFQIDITGVAELVDSIGPLSVPEWPDAIGGNNLERIALVDSYVSLSAGGADASDSGASRKAFNAALVKATWKALQHPKDVVKSVFQLSNALAERHLQVWVTSPKQEAFFKDLGWAGDIKNDPGDYLYVVDQNLGDDTLDTFASERVDYDVNVHKDGTLDVTATVTMSNFPETGLPYPLLPKDGPAVKKTYVDLYAPANAKLESVTYSDRFHSKEVPHFTKFEDGRVVFNAKSSVKPQEVGSLIFKYTVPGGLLDDHGPLYRLVVQRQPRYNAQSLHVKVTYPDGWSPKGFDDTIWTVTGQTARATFDEFVQDTVLELRF